MITRSSLKRTSKRMTNNRRVKQKTAKVLSPISSFVSRATSMVPTESNKPSALVMCHCINNKYHSPLSIFTLRNKPIPLNAKTKYSKYFSLIKYIDSGGECDATNIQYNDWSLVNESYDYIYMIYCPLYHPIYPDVLPTIFSIKEVLKNGGKLVLPKWSSLYSKPNAIITPEIIQENVGYITDSFERYIQKYDAGMFTIKAYAFNDYIEQNPIIFVKRDKPAFIVELTKNFDGILPYPQPSPNIPSDTESV
jgi:hypothetical protein